jgi:hypothetical protein
MSLMWFLNYLQIVIYVIKDALDSRSYIHFIGFWKHNLDASPKKIPIILRIVLNIKHVS